MRFESDSENIAESLLCFAACLRRQITVLRSNRRQQHRRFERAVRRRAVAFIASIAIAIVVIIIGNLLVEIASYVIEFGAQFVRRTRTTC